MRLALASIAVALLFLVAGCGSSGSETTGQADGTAESVKADVPVEIVQPDADWTAMKRKAEPWADRLVIPHGRAPDEVVTRDLDVGTGAPIRPKDLFAVRYVNYDWETGRKLEENWEPQPWRLTWQIGELVKGWEPGLAGIRAGGTREVIVPSDLAYGNGTRVYILKIVYLERS